ncbi:MAG TPA: type I methionyl aminopeptidase [Terracidiphilus sp.]|nr:type I methionyl aminopeptidase [Terracidiphilus sp.]
MSIDSEEELAGMQTAGKATRAVLDGMKAAVQAGVTTGELDEVGMSIMHRMGARSAPKLVYGFPGYSCISVNDEVVHGVPGKRKLANGDLVKLDVTVEVNGFMADACETVAVGPVDKQSRELKDCAERAFEAGLAAAVPGARAFDIGKAVQRAVSGAGYWVVRDLTGHGIGRTIHERPTIPNEFDRRCADVLHEGLVFTIEPMIAAGTPRTVTLKDGWTVRTRDRSRSAHHEHTVVLTREGARILTA